MNTLRIATRKSPLALKQSEMVKAALLERHPLLSIELCGFTTEGDQLLNTSLAKIGGKGLFIKTLEQAMLENKADIAVHSCKDMPAELSADFAMMTILERGDPRDALVSNHFSCLDALPLGAIVGTSSLRRGAQLKAMRPDLKIKLLRGNITTRLAKLDKEEYDAIVLAACGLQRLSLDSRITQLFSVEQCIPAVSQGALSVEFRRGDQHIQNLLHALNHETTEICVRAERALTLALQADCHTPIGAYATLDSDKISLHTVIGTPDGTQMIYAKIHGHLSEPEALGVKAANELLRQGAREILENY
jgi:hydroxymethylbilane synthase